MNYINVLHMADFNFWKNAFFLSNCLSRLGVLRAFVLFCVLVFVRAILAWWP